MLNMILSVLLLITHSALALEQSSTALCVSRTIKQYRPQLDLPHHQDKFKHCTLSCVIALECGPAQSWGVGILKELADLIGPGNADVKDLRANRMGIQQVIRDYARTPQECFQGCIRIYPDPPAGI